MYLPAHDMFYYASPDVFLSEECPDKTVLLGQFVIDDDKTPRVLLFDVAKLRGVSMKDIPASERYSCLQTLQPTFGAMCALQWVGDCETLAAELKTERFKVPHPVDRIMTLGSAPGVLSFTKVI